MVHAQDSFLKHLETSLGAGLPVVANPEGALGVNKLNVFFLSSTPVLRTNPGWYELLASLDLIVVGDPTQTSRRLAAQLARKVDEALSTFSVAKKDWSTPTVPVPLGTNLLPDFWGTWRRVPDPDSRFEHLNRTVAVRYFEEPR